MQEKLLNKNLEKTELIRAKSVLQNDAQLN